MRLAVEEMGLGVKQSGWSNFFEPRHLEQNQKLTAVKLS
jgi:hypothetical protein